MIIQSIITSYRIYRGYVHYNNLPDESGSLRLEQLLGITRQMLPSEREFYLNHSLSLPDVLFPTSIEPGTSKYGL